MSNLSIPHVSRHGPICIGDITLDAVVLTDGTRGYIQNQLAKAIGFSKADFAPAGILTDIVSEVIDAALAGKLHHKQLHNI